MRGPAHSSESSHGSREGGSRPRFRDRDERLPVMSYHFLLSSWGTLGNLSPLLTAGRLLRRNGHHVRVMADPAMRTEVEAAGFEYVAWRRAPTGEAADPTDFSDMLDWMRRAIFVPAGAYAADIRYESGRMATDAILSLDVLFGAA